MRRTYRRRNYTVAYLLPGCAGIGARVFLTLLAVGMLSLLWFVTNLEVIISAILGFAVLGNGIAFLLGLVVLGVALLTGKPQQITAPTYTVRIVEMRPVPALTAQAPIQPEVSPPRKAPRSHPKIDTSRPVTQTPCKRIPVYWDDKRIGWEDENGTIHFD